MSIEKILFDNKIKAEQNLKFDPLHDVAKVEQAQDAYYSYMHLKETIITEINNNEKHLSNTWSVAEFGHLYFESKIELLTKLKKFIS